MQNFRRDFGRKIALALRAGEMEHPGAGQPRHRLRKALFLSCVLVRAGIRCGPAQLRTEPSGRGRRGGSVFMGGACGRVCAREARDDFALSQSAGTGVGAQRRSEREPVYRTRAGVHHRRTRGASPAHSAREILIGPNIPIPLPDRNESGAVPGARINIIRARQAEHGLCQRRAQGPIRGGENLRRSIPPRRGSIQGFAREYSPRKTVVQLAPWSRDCCQACWTLSGDRRTMRERCHANAAW